MTRIRPIVVKIGGSILDSSRGFAVAAANIKDVFFEREYRPIVVVSAMRGVTDLLLEALRGRREALDDVEEKHISLAVDLGSPSLRKSLEGEMRVLRKLLSSGGGLPSPQLKDTVLSFGERLSRIAMEHYLRYAGLRSHGFDARSLIVTNGVYGDATILADPTRERARVLASYASRGVVPVIEGFVGSSPEGSVTTLGRGGSDYTATMLARLLGIERVFLVTSVDGVYSIDPGISEKPVLVPRLSVEEAIAASAYRVKGFNKKTFMPLRSSTLLVKIGSWRKFGTEVYDRGAGCEAGCGKPKIVAFLEKEAGLLVGLIGWVDNALVVKRLLDSIHRGGFKVRSLFYSSSSPVTSALIPGVSERREAARLLRVLHDELILQP